MCVPAYSAFSGFAPGFPCEGRPVFRGLVGHVRQNCEDLAQILFGVDLQCGATAEQAVDYRTGLTAVGSPEEKPVLFAYSGRSNRILDKVVVDLQFAVFCIDIQFIPEVQRIVDRFARQTLRQMLRLFTQQLKTHPIKNGNALLLPMGSSV